MGTVSLVSVVAWVAVAVVATAFLGLGALRLLARRSIRLHVGLVAAVCVITAMITIGEISVIMLSPDDRAVMLELMGVSGIASLVASYFVGRAVGRASGALLASVRRVGDSGIYTPPEVPLPAELEGLSRGLAEAHERLGQARAREQAFEASRRELVAWVSHDLRTPLAGLRAMAEALEDRVVVDPREVDHYHSQIRIETERLAAMIDDLFELSKIHAGALRLSPRVVGLEDLIADVVASAAPVARAKRVRLDRVGRARDAGADRQRRVRPRGQEPGDQRDQAHPARRDDRDPGRAPVRGGVRQRVRRMRRHPARGPAPGLRRGVPGRERPHPRPVRAGPGSGCRSPAASSRRTPATSACSTPDPAASS